jgi:uncharacterized protein (DUF58 family)
LVDQSRSMAYGEPLNKLEYANTLAATFAYFLQQQRDAAGLLSFDEIIREYLPARFRPGHLRQLLLLLDKPASGGKTDLLRPLDRIADLLRKRGMIVVISDFLFSLEDLQKQLRRLRAYGHEVSLFQILHPSELQLNLSGALMLEDLESEQRLYIDPHFARAPYIEKLTAHLNRLKDICRNLGIPVHLAPTDQPLERSLLHFLSDRQAVS